MKPRSDAGPKIKDRMIEIHSTKNPPNTKRNYPTNSIKTTKYTIWNFIPKNLFFQLTKLTNIYFLVKLGLQCVPVVSNTDGHPTLIFPLSLVIIVSMVKDIIEDCFRWKQDKEENGKSTFEINADQQTWADIRVGQIV